MFLAPRERDSTIDEAHTQAEPARATKPRSRPDASSAACSGPWLQVLTPRRFEWNTHELAVEGLPSSLNGLRIVHLSDLHLRSYWTRAYDDLIRRITDNPPDLLLFTGDFVESKRNQRPVLPVIRRLMDQLTPRLGIFAISGNHDGDLLAPHLADLNLTFVDGESLTIRLPVGGARLGEHLYPPPLREGLGEGERHHTEASYPIEDADHHESPTIELIGLPGPYREDFHPAFLHRIPPRQPGIPRIVLSHYPDLIQHAHSLDADLFLTGHTHGGQICLPGGRALITHDTLPKHRCKGIHRIGRTNLVINRGFGFAAIPMRLFCPAEVIDLTLRPTPSGH